MISVCIPTYNGENYIREQLNSILLQLSEDDEIILSDDGSTDSTVKIINSYDDKRIKLFYHQIEPNPYTEYFHTLYTINRNIQNALYQAKGDIIFLADQDDIWKENKVNCLLEVLKNNDLVIGNCAIMYENNIIINSYFDEIISPSRNLFRTIYKSSFHGCCLAFNRNLLNKVLPIPTLPIGHDIWIGLTAIMNNYKINFVKEITLLYRIHNKNVSISRNIKSYNSFSFKIKYRLYLLRIIFSHITKSVLY